MSKAPPDLSQLPAPQWRCLRVVSEFSDIAHAARKLHCSQAVLKAILSELQASLGGQHIHVLDGRVQISELLKVSIGGQQRPPCRAALRPNNGMSER
jgi:hypothetical protein